MVLISTQSLLMAMVCLSASALQHKFELTLEKLELVSQNLEIVNITTACLYRVNRTVKAIHIEGDLFRDLSNTTSKLVVTTLIWLSNEYRRGIIQFTRSLCDLLLYDLFDVGALTTKYSNPPLRCPFKKGTHYLVKGWVPDSRQFPPNIPEGRYKILLNIMADENTSISEFAAYVSIEYPVRWKKNHYKFGTIISRKN